MRDAPHDFEGREGACCVLGEACAICHLSTHVDADDAWFTKDTTIRQYLHFPAIDERRE